MSDTYTPSDFAFDPSPDELIALSKDELLGSTAIIRTSDRISFKRCRRRWGWQSHLKGNLGPKETANPLWFGTGMHYALEDFHGYNVYGSPAKAFTAYCEATYRQRDRVHLPAIYPELRELGQGMMTYYEQWLSNRDPLKTFWFRGKPQVEVRALIPVPWNPRDKYPNSPYTSVLYSVTIDRVTEDENGLLWFTDYKSAKQMQTQHFAADPQISAYYWAGHHIYKQPIAGFIYQQHRKDIPQTPRLLANGKLSVAKNQLTTHSAYRRVLTNIYGAEVVKWPSENLAFLNQLALEETPDSDKFIRRDRIYRNEHTLEAEGTKILLELEDMLNPDLPLYPNPARDCAYLCPFMHACLSIDDGSDFTYELDLAHSPRPQEEQSWRNLLPLPNQLSVDNSQPVQW